MNEMDERVARAIARSVAIEDQNEPDTLDKIENVLWPDYLPQARAAIAAMREPTDFVLGALHGCAPDTPDKFARAFALEIWQRAIDAALAGAPTARPSLGTGSTEL